MPNLDAEISKHNRKTLEENKDEFEKGNKLCNCRNKTNGTIGGNCLTKSVVYKATVTNKDKIISYLGSTGRELKKSYYQHMHSFRDKKS